MLSTGKPPGWFWIAAVLLRLWGMVGFVGFLFDPQVAGALPANMDAYDRHLYESRPVWLTVAYGIGTATGLLGTVALIARRAVARSLYVGSLIAVVVLFGAMLGATDLIAHKGFAAAAGLPIVIVLLAVAEIWLATIAARRGWIA